jgi:hypothetical protein
MNVVHHHPDIPASCNLRTAAASSGTHNKSAVQLAMATKSLVAVNPHMRVSAEPLVFRGVVGRPRYSSSIE